MGAGYSQCKAQLQYRGTERITNNLRGILNAWYFCFYFKFSVYGTML
ncbi:hypothetical protein VAE308_1130009 [Vibrio aestuarianus]|uniref:Uncharacterized protein n=1 Tax=Vibrio aestuarianus TaxID=28171 RepID=A0ABM9FUI6_9VIBR|nr:hypothetical protein VAE308_1130009 [Vibrio aestuarianus]CAH8241979.1 hypothetical protein VAE063_990068 [Vibrio aestuarianus]